MSLGKPGGVEEGYVKEVALGRALEDRESLERYGW